MSESTEDDTGTFVPGANRTVDGNIVTMTPETRARLEAAAGAIEERNSAIRQAYLEGASLREIARIVGMTHPGVRKIITKEQS